MISTQIERLTSLRNRLKVKLKSLGLLSENPRTVIGDDLEACTRAVESINETTAYRITNTSQKNVADYKYVQVYDQNLNPSNIRDGVSILGIEGSYGGGETPPLIVASPGYGGEDAPSIMYPPAHYYGFSMVDPIKASGSALKLTPENIVYGSRIMGEDGGIRGFKYRISCVQSEIEGDREITFRNFNFYPQSTGFVDNVDRISMIYIYSCDTHAIPSSNYYEVEEIILVRDRQNDDYSNTPTPTVRVLGTQSSRRIVSAQPLSSFCTIDTNGQEITIALGDTFYSYNSQTSSYDTPFTSTIKFREREGEGTQDRNYGIIIYYT